MNIAIVGSRTFNDYDRVKREFEIVLKGMKEIYGPHVDITIVSGGAQGADKLGERLADEFGYKKVIHYPDWKTYGKRAGFIRNQYIVDDADVVLAFWKNNSKGTEHSIDLARKQGKKLYIVEL